MHSPFSEKPHYVQGILTVTPDGNAPSQTPDLFLGK